MKIIKNNHNVSFDEIRMECKNCKSIFEYDEEDISYDVSDDTEYVKCPCCGYSNVVSKPITIDSISYPKDYTCFKNGVDIDNDQINKWVKECLHYLQDNPHEPFRYVGSGNTFVIAINHLDDDEYYVVVSKNYSDSHVIKEN